MLTYSFDREIWSETSHFVTWWSLSFKEAAGLLESLHVNLKSEALLSFRKLKCCKRFNTLLDVDTLAEEQCHLGGFQHFVCVVVVFFQCIYTVPTSHFSQNYNAKTCWKLWSNVINFNQLLNDIETSRNVLIKLCLCLLIFILWRFSSFCWGTDVSGCHVGLCANSASRSSSHMRCSRKLSQPNNWRLYAPKNNTTH